MSKQVVVQPKEVYTIVTNNVQPTYQEEPYKIPAKYFVEIIATNVDNFKLTDKAFRDFIRNTLPIVNYDH